MVAGVEDPAAHLQLPNKPLRHGPGDNFDTLYEVKCVKDLGDTFLDRELEKPVYFDDLPHPAHVPEIRYKSVWDLDFQTLNCLAVVRPHIYTDGS
ncbi:hypothetical protein EVAR_2308_1 [Eumeta japonica]|uniref:Uncharacterized protein n=1 Tax=Eumeta variegata TaxID=151549 RepID=A0A4C1SG97_EUMVA|nr:hypothetical protein EVAR_2308_1 [Eumeta japonica]